MTVKFGFYDSLNGDRLYNANDINTMFEGLFSDGVFEHVGNKLMVEPDTGNMNVLVRDGRAWFNNSWLRNTSTLTVPITPSSLIHPRKDLIIIEFDSSITVRENSIKVLTGIPAAIPIAPTLTNVSTLHQYALAEILIPTGSTEILVSNITNKIGTSSTPYAISLISEPSSGGSNSFVINEIASGSVNGVNKVFNTLNPYVPGTLQVFRDGQLMTKDGDYTETSSTSYTFATAPLIGSVIQHSYQYSLTVSGNADTLDGQHASAFAEISHTHAAGDVTSSILNMARFPLARGQMINGKLSVTVVSNDLVLAIKTIAGGDPSVSDPVYVRIGDTIRSITSFLSITLADGTNWMNLGSTGLGTIEQDLFAYVVWDSNSSIVALAHSRIPYGNLVSDFSSTTTNEKYLAGYSGFTSTDEVEVIGRFAATLSLSGTGHLWIVPTFTAANLIQKPIYTTRKLAWNPTVTAQTGTPTSVTTLCYYKLNYDEITYNPDIAVNNAGTASGHMKVSSPMNAAVVSAGSGREIAATGKGLSTNIYAPDGNIYINFYDGTTVWVNGHEVNATIRGFLT